MKKILIIIVVTILFIAGLIGAVVVFKDQSAGTAVTGSTGPFVSVKACDVLTEKIAKEILGDDIVKSDGGSDPANSADLSVTNCNYLTKAQPTSSIPKADGVSLLVRGAKTSVGADSNKSQFENSKAAGAESVDGIGDAAFFNPQFRQLNVLKGNNWYIVTSYKDNITNSSLESDKALAQKLSYK